MTPATPRRNRDEVARLGTDIYERQIKPLLRPEDDDKFVAIDIVTGEYEIDAGTYAAVRRLRGRLPGAEIWLLRVGHSAAEELRGHR